MNNYPYDRQEDEGSMLGTAAKIAGLAGAGALAMPIGRPVRKALGNWYEAFGSPLGNTAAGIAKDYNKLGVPSMAKKAANAMTGGSANLAGYGYGARADDIARAATHARLGQTGSEFAGNLALTTGGIKNAARTAYDTLTGIVPAVRAVGKTADLTKLAKGPLGAENFGKNKLKLGAWKNFVNKDIAKGIPPEDLDEIGKLFAKDEVGLKTPAEAAILYYKLLGKHGG